VAKTSAELTGWPAGRGLIVCGPGAASATPASRADDAALATALWRCADALALPVLVDPLSGLRTGPGSAAGVSTYDALLRNPNAADALRPDWVLRIGETPISKVLSQWLDGVPAILATQSGRWPDPTHDAVTRLELPPAAICEALVAQGLVTPDRPWLANWHCAEQRVRALAEQTDDSRWTERQVISTLRRSIPDDEALFCANSMPIRQLDCWWGSGGPKVALFGNRGASGIDGYLSTLAGLCDAGLHCWGLTGDLSFCHDLSGLLLADRLDRPLLVLNNGGGHIFDYLPQREMAEYARLWQTPQPVSIPALARISGLRVWTVQDQTGLEEALAELSLGPGVIEIRIDPERSRAAHRDFWAAVSRAQVVLDA
jgi:2-succinyl-5-enolpyruvyl-6-hydroxy-3-cyclohexene-1-carboxylate synthase